MFIIDVDVLTRSKLIDLLKRKKSKTRMMPRFGINIGNEVFIVQKCEDWDGLSVQGQESTYEFRLLNDKEEWIHLCFDSLQKRGRIHLTSSNETFCHPNLKPTVDEIVDDYYKQG